MYLNFIFTIFYVRVLPVDICLNKFFIQTQLKMYLSSLVSAQTYKQRIYFLSSLNSYNLSYIRLLTSCTHCKNERPKLCCKISAV